MRTETRSVRGEKKNLTTKHIYGIVPGFCGNFVCVFLFPTIEWANKSTQAALRSPPSPGPGTIQRGYLCLVFLSPGDSEQILEPAALNLRLNDRHITHLICVRLKHLVYDFWGDVLGLLPVVFLI